MTVMQFIWSGIAWLLIWTMFFILIEHLRENRKN